MVFPENFGGVLAGDSLQDLLATCGKGMLVDKATHNTIVDVPGSKGGNGKNATKRRANLHHTWVVILELGNVIDITIDDDVHVIALVVRRDVARRKSFRHDGLL